MAEEDLTTVAADLVNTVRTAGSEWGQRSIAERVSALKAAASVILGGADELAAILHEETRRPVPECYSGDVVGVADLFAYWTKHGPAMLVPRKGRIPALDMPGKTAVVEREPRGVIAVISPWNYPVSLPMRVIVPALLAGNGVVLKPSEHTPRSGRWIVDKLREHVGEAIAVMDGDRAAGAALIEAKPDMVHFTGSTRTGRLVAVACAERAIPCEMELGGKDAAIVLDDAALDRTAAGIAWGIVHNTGQDCASIERVLVHAGVADKFLPLLAEKLKAATSDIPHLTTDLQRQHVMAQLNEAKAMGAEFLTGSIPADASTPIPPTLLTNVPRTAGAWRDETFGPVAVVEVHPDDDALVDAANDTTYGLGGSVWSQNLARGERVGRRLRTGMVWVNNHAFTGAVPDLPWVGRGASGTGLTSSPESLDHLTRPRVVVVDKSKGLEPWWYPYSDNMLGLMKAVVERQRVGGLGATFKTLGALSARNKELKG